MFYTQAYSILEDFEGFRDPAFFEDLTSEQLLLGYEQLLKLFENTLTLSQQILDEIAKCYS
jgi:hypothetical protein